LDRSRAKSNFSTSAPFKSTTRKEKNAPSAFKVGDRVFHDKFGYGAVITLDGNKLDVDFENGSRRKVMDSFVSPV